MLNVDKTYVVHYTRLIERRQKLQSQFRDHKIQAEYISSYDKDDLTTEEVEGYYVKEESSYDDSILKTYGPNSAPFRTLSDAEISCTIKHYEAIRRLGIECENYGLIFEDDVVLVDNFVELFNSYLERTPENWDAIFMGSCCDLKISSASERETEIAFLKEHPASKCADGYILRKELAEKITKTMIPFNTISDWELGHQLAIHDANVYWWEPPLLHQGSETGFFQSTLACPICKIRGCNGDCK
jgi:GR25 family glycosyltransferase involved in LPS biosynthesis